MQSKTSRIEYERRLNLVVNHVVEHLDESMSLDDLAGIAAWSPYHFHRVFKAMMGETLTECIWRLRLERAANRLQRQPETSISRIALDCGFGTPSSFSRAFRHRFGMTASEFRTRGRAPEQRKLGKAEDASVFHAPCVESMRTRNVTGRSQMNVTIQELPAYHVAFIRQHGYAKGVFQEHLNAAFQKVCGWAGQQGLFGPDTLVIGVPYDNPDITPHNRCRYDACVTIPEHVTEATNGIATQALAGGLYAIHRIDVRDPAEIGRAVDALYGEWLPSSGYQTDDRPCLEIYRESGETPPGSRIVLDFCIPVTQLRQ